ncbi:hypothetical protein MMC27_005687 [Xylographa pallens]|nr:hypothetical protein [Xylographa pallens]
MRHGNDDALFTPEPFLETAQERESGVDWERSTFGGRVNAINGERSGRYGVSITDWPSLKQHQWQTSFYAVRMDYIERIQQQEHWNSTARLPEDENRSRYFYVPRYECAVGWGHGVVMPMRFEDLEKERLWNLADEEEAEEDRLEELDYAENDKIQDELDRKEEQRKTKEKELALAKEADALLEKERARYEKERQRAEDDARIRYRDLFGDNDPWTFEGIMRQQHLSKRPSMRVPTPRRVNDRRSRSPEDEPARIPPIDNAVTQEIARLRRERERREERAAQDRIWKDRDMEQRAMEIRRDRERERGLFPASDMGGWS